MQGIHEMTFREDESRVRKKQTPLVFNVMRKIAMTLFKQYTAKSASIARKIKWQGLTMIIAQPCYNLGLRCASHDFEKQVA
jgi:hypothetical protein